MNPYVPLARKRASEVVALVGECGEDVVALVEQRGEPRERRGECNHEIGVAVQSAHREALERYAVVSCHVERPLDDAVWSRFSALQEKRPAGFRIAALVRPPDAAFGEDEGTWLERAQQAAANGPFGQHTHWTAPDHARPTSDGTGARVLADGRWMAEAGLAPAFFCGGGWYTDAEVADACAELGYVDCTPRASAPAVPRGRCAVGVTGRSGDGGPAVGPGAARRSRRPTRSAILRARCSVAICRTSCTCTSTTRTS